MTDTTEPRKQLLEAMSAVSEDRTCTGWAADWARTLHAEGGIWETLGRAVGWPTGNYDAWVWVSWEEAARLYGHETPAASVVVPAADRAALRDRIAASLSRYRMFFYWAPSAADVLRADLAEHLAADLGLQPAPADRAAVRAEAFDEAAEKLAALPREKAVQAGESAWKDAAGIVRHMAVQERRMVDGEESAAVDRVAAETPQPETRPLCPDCQMPHDLTPGMALACASICASIADHGPAVEAQPGKDTETPQPKEA
jgi:hypothetical protein